MSWVLYLNAKVNEEISMKQTEGLIYTRMDSYLFANYFSQYGLKQTWLSEYMAASETMQQLGIRKEQDN